MRRIAYNRNAAVEYARRWAYSRNPNYYNFDDVGGDCTSFASQCLYAGTGVMNFTPVYGWYYLSSNERTASWTGVEYFYNFLTGNLGNGEYENASTIGNVIGLGYGPFAKEVPVEEVEIGDFIQLGRATGDFYHTPIVVGFSGEMPLVAAHTYDAFNRPLNTYNYDRLRCIHILGARTD